MEYKKKTIIWEDNNEPPKDYIWAKKDGKFYEYSYTTMGWVESKSISGGNSGSSNDGEDSTFNPLSLVFPGIIGFVDSSDDSWPINSIAWDHWVLTKDIIPVDDIKDYMEAKIGTSGQDDYGTCTFLPVLEYNEDFDNHDPSFTNIEIIMVRGKDPYIDSMSSYSYNAKVWKGDTAYLVGIDPGD